MRVENEIYEPEFGLSVLCWTHCVKARSYEFRWKLRPFRFEVQRHYADGSGRIVFRFNPLARKCQCEK